VKGTDVARVPSGRDEYRAEVLTGVLDAADQGRRLALEDLLDAAATEAAPAIRLDFDDHPVAVHGGADTGLRNGDRHVVVVGQDDRLAAPPDAHGAGDEPEPRCERDAALARAHELAAFHETVDGALDVGRFRTCDVRQLVDLEVLALGAAQPFENRTLERVAAVFAQCCP
jgi:hypothetical protein